MQRYAAAGVAIDRRTTLLHSGELGDAPRWHGPARHTVGGMTDQAAPPADHAPVLIGGAYGHAFAIDAVSGATLWNVTLSRFEGSPVAIALDADSVFAANDTGDLFCIERATGQVRWQVTLQGVNSRVTLLADGDVVYACKGGYIECFGVADGRRRWMSDAPGDTAALGVPGNVVQADTQG